MDALLVTDLDDTLLGDPVSTAELWEHPWRRSGRLGVAAATGRSLRGALGCIQDHRLDPAEFVALATSVGSEVYYDGGRRPDLHYADPYVKDWSPTVVRSLLDPLPVLSLQPLEEQRPFKVSYFVDNAPTLEERVRRTLADGGQRVQLVFSLGVYLDVMPWGLSKGSAVRHLAHHFGLGLDRVVTAGDSGNDRGMLSCGAWAIVVANHGGELEALRGQPRIHFSEREYAAGILEGLRSFLEPLPS